jgi:hypothetical protein
MRKYSPLFLGLLLLVAPARAAEPQGKLVEDLWEAAQLDGVRVGHFRTTVRQLETDSGGKVLRTTQRMELSFKRYESLIRLRAEIGTDETPEGKVVGAMLRLPQEKGELVLTGRVTDEGLRISVNGGRADKVVPWDAEVIGLYRQERFFKERKLKSGDTFSFRTFEPTITSVVTVRGMVGEEEEVATPKGKKRLLRVEAKPDPVEGRGSDGRVRKVQLPGLVLWLDKELLPVRRQMEIEGIGKIVSYRTTREAALAAGGGAADLPDIGNKTLIPLNRGIARPHDTRSVVYRVTIKGDADPATAVAHDARQEIKHVKGNSFELHVRAVREPQKVADPEASAKEEYLKSCYFIKSDDKRVRELAGRAVGDETDALRKARRIERWVHDNMRHSNAVGFAPADQVARDLAGDCRQHAMLAAAMCRAAGVPSRTALGVVYALDGQRRPVMWFHMWTEVWARGQWLAIDATLGEGSIGAAHVKIADHSWTNTESLEPMLDVQRVLGKMSVEVVSVE